MNINPVAASTSNSTNQSNPAPGVDNTFLTLLVAQLKNQSPLSPIDANQFTTELTQINMLNELTQIRDLLSKATTTSTGS
jgi:flagellar basal-body rod modification protein FlgD